MWVMRRIEYSERCAPRVVSESLLWQLRRFVGTTCDTYLYITVQIYGCP